MPLPGGPSDKAGNRYELLWTADRLVDLILGRAESIRLEPPDVDGIEFRLELHSGFEVHQVKRGYASEGRWSISRLMKVLTAFKNHLLSDNEAICVFVSGDGVLGLKELADRARSSESYDEYNSAFLNTESHQEIHSDLSTRWSLNSSKTWALLRRIRFETIDEQQLKTKLEQLLGLLFDAPASSVRSILCQMILEQTHATLSATDVLEHLKNLGIDRVPIAPTATPRSLFEPPLPAELFGRKALLSKCSERLKESPTLIFVGPSGIGKSSMAVLLCSAPQFSDAVWIDCTVVAGIRSALTELHSLATNYSDTDMDALLRRPHPLPKEIGRSVASFLNRHRLLLVWDGIHIQEEDAIILEAISVHLNNGAQIATSTDSSAIERLGWNAIEEVPPLAEPDAIALFRALNGTRPSQEILRVVHGHPYLIQLAARARTRLTPDDAIAMVRQKGDSWLTSKVLKSLDTEQQKILERCSVYRTGFRAEWVAETAAEREQLRSLAMLHLVIVGRGDLYSVHELVRSLVEQGLSNERRFALHNQASSRMIPHRDSNMLELREYGYHALKAGLNREALRILTGLVYHAAQDGQWATVLELTESLPEANLSADWSIVWYHRGRALRLMERITDALYCYRLARNSASEDFVGYAKFEEASMLALLGHDKEAREIYEELTTTGNTRFAVEAQVALGLMNSQDGKGNYEESQHLLSQAINTAQQQGYWRAELQAEQVWGRVALNHNRLEDAYQHLHASYQARMERGGDSVGFDLIGWRNLYQCLLELETKCGNRLGAVSAANGLLEFSIVSDNPIWIAEATYEFCANTENGHERVHAAIQIVEHILDSATSEQHVIVIAGYLAAAKWCIGNHENALRTLLEIDKEGEHMIVPLVFSSEFDTATETDELALGYWLKAIPIPPAWLYKVSDLESLKRLFSILALEYPHSERILLEAIHALDEES